MIIRKYNGGGRLFNYLAQGGRMEEGGEMPETQEVEMGEEYSTDPELPKFKVVDGKLMQLQSQGTGRYTENVNPEALFRYLNENRVLITPDGTGNTTYHGEMTMVRRAINEAVRTSDLSMLADYIDPTKDGLDMIIPGFVPNETPGAELPIGKNRERYGTSPRQQFSIKYSNKQ